MKSAKVSPLAMVAPLPMLAALPKHKRPANAEAFLTSLSPIERQLQELAQEKLGSSYFMEKTSAYKKFVASLNSNNKK